MLSSRNPNSLTFVFLALVLLQSWETQVFLLASFKRQTEHLELAKKEKQAPR